MVQRANTNRMNKQMNIVRKVSFIRSSSSDVADESLPLPWPPPERTKVVPFSRSPTTTNDDVELLLSNFILYQRRLIINDKMGVNKLFLLTRLWWICPI